MFGNKINDRTIFATCIFNVALSVRWNALMSFVRVDLLVITRPTTAGKNLGLCIFLNVHAAEIIIIFICNFPLCFGKT